MIAGPPGQAVVETRDDLQHALDDGEHSGVRAAIHALFVSIPHDWYRNNPLASYVFEFKVVERASEKQGPEGRALSQLREQGYADNCTSPGVTVTLVGIEFGKAERNLVGFKVGRAEERGANGLLRGMPRGHGESVERCCSDIPPSAVNRAALLNEGRKIK